MIKWLSMGTPLAVREAHPEVYREYAIRLEYFTIAWHSLEALVALVAGLMAGSIALKGFGFDSVIETACGATLLWRLRQRAKSEETAESRALWIVGLTFFALAAYVGYESLTDLLFGHHPRESLIGILVACVSFVVMPLLGRSKRRVARRLGSRALAADGMQNYLSSFLSFTLLAGLGLNAWQGWWWADPVAALAMVALVIREGVHVLRGSPG